MTPELKTRVEDQIESYESHGKDGIVPRITGRDYLIEAAIGIVLTLYLVVELFLV